MHELYDLKGIIKYYGYDRVGRSSERERMSVFMRIVVRGRVRSFLMQEVIADLVILTIWELRDRLASIHLFFIK